MPALPPGPHPSAHRPFWVSLDRWGLHCLPGIPTWAGTGRLPQALPMPPPVAELPSPPPSLSLCFHPTPFLIVFLYLALNLHVCVSLSDLCHFCLSLSVLFLCPSLSLS